MEGGKEGGEKWEGGRYPMALFPDLSHFYYSSVCVHNDTWKRKSDKVFFHLHV